MSDRWQSQIYAVQTGDDLYFKIGVSGDLKSRLWTLGSSPSGVRLVGAWLGDKKAERQLQAQLAPWSSYGSREWFHATTEVARFIRRWVRHGIGGRS